MKISVRYFASLRETLGPGETVDDVPADTTVGALRDRLVASSPRHAQALAHGRAVRCAVDKAMADEAQVLHDGAEVAYFPPVTGG